MVVAEKDRIGEMQKAFVEKFGAAPSVIVRAPGRVNLIGEHTDYNEGFVFPAAIDREMIVAASTNESDVISAYSLDYDESVSFSVEQIAASAEHQWSNYLRGVVDVLVKKKYKIAGLNLVTSGNVPQGAGLSSSAAFEVALVSVLNLLYDLNIDKTEIALLAQKAENDFVGVQCGIMDQFVSALGEEDAAIMIDCRSLEYKVVPLKLEEKGYSIVITHSGVHRGLVNSEYNARRAECAEGVTRLAELTGRPLNSLRDVTLQDLFDHKNALADKVFRRSLHVVSENQRVLDAVSALENEDIDGFGTLMNESHESMKTNFEISTDEIDLLVGLTQKFAAARGARMTGAGFGGCTVAVIETSSINDYKDTVIAEYEKATGKQTSVYVCAAKKGVSVI